MNQHIFMEMIKYYSTNKKATPVNFRDALLQGIAPDRGLYMPNSIPTFTKAEIDAFSEMEYFEIAYLVGRKFLSDEIPDENLYEIVKSAYNFEVPLEKVVNRSYVMRLDQGPTASFKDFAARMMGQLMQYYLKKENRSLLILTATSGDTGSAIANAFYGLDNIKVVILYPVGEVTDRQRKQMTTLQKNIQIIAIDGKFDHCQALVKQAFADPDLDKLRLSSANSINIGRLLPQSMYYFYAYAMLQNHQPNDEIVFSVPSGNFGDLMGGLIAKQMGLPIKQFVVAVNENDEVPVFFDTKHYEKIEPSKNCISSAMNVGHPSNLSRLVALYGGTMDENGNITEHPDYKKINSDLFAISISDDETKATIKSAHSQYNLLLEPHGAVGWKGLEEYSKTYPEAIAGNQLCVVLETAHPAKFPKEINEFIGIDPALPPSLQGIESKEESFVEMQNNFDDFKKYLLANY